MRGEQTRHIGGFLIVLCLLGGIISLEIHEPPERSPVAADSQSDIQGDVVWFANASSVAADYPLLDNYDLKTVAFEPDGTGDASMNLTVWGTLYNTTVESRVLMIFLEPTDWEDYPASNATFVLAIQLDDSDFVMAIAINYTEFHNGQDLFANKTFDLIYLTAWNLTGSNNETLCSMFPTSYLPENWTAAKAASIAWSADGNMIGDFIPSYCECDFIDALFPGIFSGALSIFCRTYGDVVVALRDAAHKPIAVDSVTLANGTNTTLVAPNYMGNTYKFEGLTFGNYTVSYVREGEWVLYGNITHEAFTTYVGIDLLDTAPETNGTLYVMIQDAYLSYPALDSVTLVGNGTTIILTLADVDHFYAFETLNYSEYAVSYILNGESFNAGNVTHHSPNTFFVYIIPAESPRSTSWWVWLAAIGGSVLVTSLAGIRWTRPGEKWCRDQAGKGKMSWYAKSRCRRDPRIIL